MKARAKKSAANSRVSWGVLCVTVLASSAMVTGLLAQSGTPSAEGRPMASSAAPERPNYDLASRFFPDKMEKLVFDVSVTAHWFELSDRFWYSYETPDGARYWLVDLAKKSKTPLWDNAKVAEALSTLTNFPYDPQHLPIKNPKLVNKDTAIRFEVEVLKDAVIPNEVKKAASEEEQQENNQEGNKTQMERGGRGQAGEVAEPPSNTRTIYFQYDLASGKVTRLDGFEDLKRPTWAYPSPDEKTVVFARGHNLYMVDAENYKKAQKKPDDSTIVETQLTTDGVEKYSYARQLLPEDLDKLKKEDKGDSKNKADMRTPPIPIHWSNDSKKFALIREDDRKVAELWEVHTLASPRPTLETHSYAMPGDENVPIGEIHVFDVAAKHDVEFQPKKFGGEMIALADSPLNNHEREEGLLGMGVNPPAVTPPLSRRWLSQTSDKLYFTSMSRDYKHVAVCVADTSNGNVKTLLQEDANLWLDVRPLRLVNNGEEIIWWSERDGWGHYYLYDGDGKLKSPITSGEYMADEIIYLDEKARVLYFTATGREQNEDPLYLHLYRINLDGTGLKLMSPGNASHLVLVSDSGKYFLDNFSRVDTAPRSVVDDDMGNQVLDLETTDVKRLLEAGYKFPETFKVKADDGITDIYGVMYKPFDFDPSRKYPVIEYVYPGPQTEGVTITFNKANQSVALAQAGFIVIEVGARGGAPQRDKWYDSFGYGNFRDYGLADKKAAAEQLAAVDPYIDVNRVGIWGHSGGGFMSAAALLQYPDFFKAAWSESGNHDNNVYNKGWSEKYNGVKEEAEKDGTTKFVYEVEKNSEVAKNLKGHLMLTSGDMDDNVNIANTMHLADALIKANKRFEMLIFPGVRHPYAPITDYVLQRRIDFFAHWLLGSYDTDPNIIELQRDKQATPSSGHNLGETGTGGREGGRRGN
jgi:dipeptidyl-peptidase-4